PLQDVTADLPVEQHQFAVDRQRGPLLGTVDAVLQLAQPVGVAFRSWNEGHGLVAHSASPLVALSAASSSVFSACWAACNWRVMSWYSAISSSGSPSSTATSCGFLQSRL